MKRRAGMAAGGALGLPERVVPLVPTGAEASEDPLLPVLEAAPGWGVAWARADAVV